MPTVGRLGVEMVTPILRKSNDIGFFGNKSQGKTLTLAFLGFIHWLYTDTLIFSNFPLRYPHILIESIDDIKRIREYPQQTPKLFLASDFERWFNSRKSMTKTNLDIGTITMDLGKCNCSLYYDSKRPAIIDIGLRDTSDYIAELRLIMPFQPNTGDHEIDDAIIQAWSNDLEKCWIQITLYDGNLNYQKDIYLRNLHLWGRLYNTMGFTQELQKEHR